MSSQTDTSKPSSPKKHYTGKPRDLWALTGWRHPIYFLHAAFYLGNTKRYIAILSTIYEWIQKYVPDTVFRWTLTRYLLNWFPRRYHGKVLTYENTTKLLNLNVDVEVDPEEAKRVLPYEMVNQIVLKNPDKIAIGDCGCRVRQENPCQPLHVCMFIGEPFATYAVTHGGKRLNIHYATQEEALEVLKQAHEAGFVHNAFFKDVFGDRLFAICNCCTCCCGVMSIQKDFLTFYPEVEPPPKMLSASGYVAVRDESRCEGCGTCVKGCPFNAVSLNGGKKVELIEYRCFGCGACIDKCPNGAIHLQRDTAKGIPLDIEALM